MGADRLPDDARAWLWVFELSLVDRDNDDLACLCDQMLGELLERHGVKPGRRQRPEKTRTDGA